MMTAARHDLPAALPQPLPPRAVQGAGVGHIVPHATKTMRGHDKVQEGHEPDNKENADVHQDVPGL